MTFRSRNLFLFSIVSLAFLSLGNYFISDSFAVNFQDSSGYTPSWAQGAEYHSVLLKCDEFTGSNSQDEKWCMEWVAYVLDQGVENFPQSVNSVQLSPKTTTSSSQSPVLGVSEGQWVKYRIVFENDFGFTPESLKNIPGVFGEIGIQNIDQTEWLKITVSKISGNEVTFDSIVQFKDGSTQVLEKKTQKYEDRLQMPMEAAPINIKLGEKFETPVGMKSFQFIGTQNLEDYPEFCLLSDLCKRKNAETMIIQSFTEGGTSNLDVTILANMIYEKTTGILLEQSVRMDVFDKKNSDYKHVLYSLEAIDFSTETIKTVDRYGTNYPTKYEVVNKLNDFMVKGVDKRYWITNEEIEYNKGQMITTFDILRPDDNYKIGAVIIKGDEKVTSVYSQSLFDSSDRNAPSPDTANDILQLIRLRLVPDCCGDMDNHNALWIDNGGKGTPSISKRFGNMDLELSMYTDPSLFTGGLFMQQITYDFSGKTKSTASTTKPVEVKSETITEKVQKTETIPSQESELPDWAKAILGFLVLIGILAIIIGPIAWKIKQKKSKERKLREKEWKGI